MLKIEKMLFPNLPWDLRRRKMNTLVITALVSAIFAGVMVVVITKFEH